jgi:hypothetical protein
LAPCSFLDLDAENGAQEDISIYIDLLTERLSKINNEAGKKESDALFNSYLLNEIKSQDDAIKQVMSISGLLIGAYATVMVNSIGKIPSGLLNNTILIHLQDTTGPKYAYILLIIPLLLWFYALLSSVLNLSPSIKRWHHYESSNNTNYQLGGENSIRPFLIETAQRKYRTYKISSITMIIGLMVAIGIAIGIAIVMLSVPTE